MNHDNHFGEMFRAIGKLSGLWSWIVEAELANCDSVPIRTGEQIRAEEAEWRRTSADRQGTLI